MDFLKEGGREREKNRYFSRSPFFLEVDGGGGRGREKKKGKKLTLFTPASMSALAHGGVLPWCAQGSRVT